MSQALVAIDAGSRDLAAAEHVVHLLDDVLPAGDPSYVASTHVVETEAGGRRLAVAASWSAVAPPGLVAGLVSALGTEVGILLEGSADRATRQAGPTDAVAGARAAAAEHRSRTTGRLARYPGRDAIERRLTAGEVVRRSAVDSVEGLAGTDVGDDAEVDLTGWARPAWREGRVVLLVQPARHALVPFEARDQIPCCSSH